MPLPAAPLLSRRKVLGVSIETTSGTQATTTSSMASTVVYNPRLAPGAMLDAGKRMPSGTYLGAHPASRGMRSGTLSFRTELRYGDQFLTLLKGCGYVTSSTTAAPTSAVGSQKTLSFALWEEGRRKNLYGACGNCVISADAAGILFCDWSFQGIYGDVVDEASPTTSIAAAAPWTMKGISTLQIASSTIPLVSRFSLDLGAKVEMRENATLDSGIAHFFIVDREPTLTLDTEAHKIADFANWTDLLAGTTRAFSFTTTSGGHSVTFSAPAIQRMSIADEDRGGRIVDASVFQLCASSGDDELAITIV